MTTTTNGEQPKVKSPQHLAHVLLKTTRLDEMIDFYVKLLGGKVAFRNKYMAFVAYDDEHHRIAIGALPHTGPPSPHASGLEHIAFTYDTLDDLALSYEQRKKLDPDGNHLEMQVDNFDTADEATEYMMSAEFDEEPIGYDFQPEELIARLRGGEDHKSIKRRMGSGGRRHPPYSQPVHI
ncbi:hypothetical protein LTR20_006774 [Exophiala xenobiotica]|nr:hypothetical protein LTR41_007779 [Exophiala xenobiotica]KAK5255327.1 hypothetical protein LTS06_000348 [Exophiala xenobiotica]KAK5348553.1 hypothetical protein LTR61_007580 [Exophiala xenobiotica]KAK5366795.1 hypothetical protein LTR11_007963 [Exophiala xenobiotica]KAK5392723.1 hypothetical protein LTR79_009626 [Exophiala xenobiotica]